MRRSGTRYAPTPRVKLVAVIVFSLTALILTLIWILNSNPIETLKREEQQRTATTTLSNLNMDLPSTTTATTTTTNTIQQQQQQQIESLKKQLSDTQQLIQKLNSASAAATTAAATIAATASPTDTKAIATTDTNTNANTQAADTTATTTTTTKPGYIYHINFAEGCCKTAQKRNCELAYSKGLVDKCLMYDMSALDAEFREKNKAILTKSRGAGYWLWKPYIILHTMVNIAKPGDYIVYTDADSENNRSFFDPNEKIKELLDTQNIVVFPVGLPENDWTKRDAYILLNMDSDPEVKSSWQMNAVAVLVKNTFKAQRFISEWLTYMQDERASTDEPNKLGQPNVKGFSQHRHDQSVLSLLVKKWKLELHGLKDILNNNIYGHG